MTDVLMRALDRIPQLDPTYVTPGPEDYLKYPAPWWARLTNPWEAQHVARQKTRAERRREFDILWVHGWENMVAMRDAAERMPAAAAMDSVPSTMDRQLRLRGVGGWKRRVSHQVHDRAFRTAAAEFDYFLPKSSDCAAALDADYGIGPKRSFVTLAPQDLDWWAPAPKKFEPPWRLLFAGNDFERKGGDFLLRLYEASFTRDCTLTILSNDASLESRKLPRGARWIRGASREEVRQAYWDSHLFLFPTLQDFAPQVLAEAASAGLAAIVSEVDGSGDLVRDGESGFVLPRGSPVERWTDKIRGLLSDAGRLERMSACARGFAEERLSLARFDELVCQVAELMCAELRRR